MESKLNISQIARQLKVSKTTVSRVFNNAPNSGISQATRQRVLSAIRELGYEPNLSARALAKARTHIIGAMFINITSRFVNSFVSTMEELAGQNGYHVILCNSRGNPLREKEECRMLRQRGVEGLIVEHVGSGEHLVEMMEKNYPVVLTGFCADAPQVDYVGFDEVGGGMLATRTLAEAGRRRIAYIAGPPDAGAMEMRTEGYCRALKELGRSVNPAWIIQSARYEDVAAGREAMAKLLSLSDRPDGVFCHDDLIAVGAMQAVMAAGLRVPEDIAIIGYGNNYSTPWSELPLPSIQLDTAKLGRETCRLLLGKIDNNLAPDEPRQIKLAPFVVRRELLGMK